MNPRDLHFENPGIFKQAMLDGKNALRDVAFDMAGLQSITIGIENSIPRGKFFMVQWKEEQSEITRVVRSDEPMTIIVPATRQIKVVFSGDDVTIDQP